MLQSVGQEGRNPSGSAGEHGHGKGDQERMGGLFSLGLGIGPQLGYSNVNPSFFLHGLSSCVIYN